MIPIPVYHYTDASPVYHYTDARVRRAIGISRGKTPHIILFMVSQPSVRSRPLGKTWRIGTTYNDASSARNTTT
jgi:hypothetical protein